MSTFGDYDSFWNRFMEVSDNWDKERKHELILMCIRFHYKVFRDLQLGGDFQENQEETLLEAHEERLQELEEMLK